MQPAASFFTRRTIGRITIACPNGRHGWLLTTGFMVVFPLTIKLATVTDEGFVAPLGMLLYAASAAEVIGFMWILLFDIRRSGPR